ncbi:sensor histidine kinase [Niabella drilacis]|uniref:Histidine kinase n=1 Tax=Niabella drilacis (strain DSM 25811 / CCM 8410 / CCUG 62505 / LMG 26954 / E90) TaxID=1285928 RepID=A0A1G6NA61_NIADE|nr:histidine kinase [Niabella drilacis]SDC64738.1 Histidine kinase [Niabella drilacis]
MMRLSLILLLYCLLLYSPSYAQEFRGAVETKAGFLSSNSNGLKKYKNKIADAKDLDRLLKDSIKFKDINLFLLHKKTSNKSLGYEEFANGRELENTCRKINDSLYEIYINTPSKEVLFAYRENDRYGPGWYGKMTGGLNAPDAMGGDYDSLIIKTGRQTAAFKLYAYNPFLYGSELFIWDKKENKNAITFKLLFQFPQPQLEGAATDTLVINKKREDPSFNWYPKYDSLRLDHQKATIKKGQQLVLVFKHFLDYYRWNYMDNLFYRIDSTSGWSLTPLASTPSILLEDLKPGKHLLQVKYPVDEAPVFTYEIEVLPRMRDSPIWWVLSGIVVSGVGFLFINRRRLRAAQQKAQKTRLELQAIQSQLNPHFMFNALGSVQYLMHNNEKQKADHYLTEFSALLRSSLSNNENEMIPLSRELQVLNSYIALEQLRFGFRYQCTIGRGIAPDTIPVPTLLMQPLVENAIKHGLSSLREKGLLEIRVQQQESDLLIAIIDNGPGFAPAQLYTGLGTKLVKERIGLLRRNGYQVELSFATDQKNETKVCLKFRNWA